MWPAVRDHLLTPLLDLVFPQSCLNCHTPFDSSPDSHAVCPPCRTAILADPFECCPRCANTIGPFEDIEGGCSKCRDESFAFERAIRLGPYAGELRDAILAMKEWGGEPLAETVGHLWAAGRFEQFRAIQCTVVVPVPLHWKRRFGRGYNQSEALARGIAGVLKLPFSAGLRRIRHTPMQTGLSREERLSNVRGAFARKAGQATKGARVLLTDDVMTTGSTCSSAAGALLAAGAAQVVVAVLAHR